MAETLSRDQEESPIKNNQLRQSAINFIKTRSSPHARHLNWFNGVMMPTCENLWGVIIFLRFYYIVGQAGIVYSIVVVFISFINAMLTVLSLSAIATSGTALERGGPYYMISRSLGPYVGASIGLTYYLGLILLGVLQVLGAVQVFHNSSNTTFELSHQVQTVSMLIVQGLIMLFAIKLIKKLGFVFFTVVCLTMIGFFIGLFMAPYDTDAQGLTGLQQKNLEDNLYDDYDPGVDFGVILSIFFPCFACIFSGSHHGKDLVKPTQSIPKGTFLAVILSFFIYVAYMILWGAVAQREYLKGNFDYYQRLLLAGNDKGKVVKDISVGPHYILEIGIIIASLSMGLQCFIVAYKLLKDVAHDKVVPGIQYLQKIKIREEPLLALILTLGIGGLFAISGSVDAVAPMLTMCFLMMYVLVNTSCFLMCIILTPSWKPPGIRRARWRTLYRFCSLMGALLSLTLMFIVHWAWALGVIFGMLIIYIYISYRGLKADWGSGLQGLKFQLSMIVLHQLQKETLYTLNWRPQLLCYYSISDNARYSVEQLLQVVQQLNKGRGLVVIIGMLPGEPSDPPTIDYILSHKNALISNLKAFDLKSFPKIMVSYDIAQAIGYSWMCVGLGGLTPNTILLDMPTDPNDQEILEFCRIVKLSYSMSKAVMVVKDLPNFPSELIETGNLDIWWIIHDGGILIYLSYLLSQYKTWRKCTKRVFIVGENMADKQELEKDIHYFFNQHLQMSVKTKITEINDQEIHPYTLDWTFKVRNRAKILEELNRASSMMPSVLDQGEQVPMMMRRRMTEQHQSPEESGINLYMKKYENLNRAILSESENSSLVLITMPEPNFDIDLQESRDYFDYLSAISSGLNKVIFMLGAGTELIKKH